MRVETERRRRRRNRDEWRDGNWATDFTDFLGFSPGQGYVGGLTAAKLRCSKSTSAMLFLTFQFVRTCDVFLSVSIYSHGKTLKRF